MAWEEKLGRQWGSGARGGGVCVWGGRVKIRHWERPGFVQLSLVENLK